MSDAPQLSALRHPSGFIPLLMSLVAMATIVVHLAVHGTARQPDEGAAARLWQLLMAGQIPVIIYFAARWVSESPRRGLLVLAIQIAAWIAAAAPIFILEW